MSKKSNQVCGCVMYCSRNMIGSTNIITCNPLPLGTHYLNKIRNKTCTSILPLKHHTPTLLTFYGHSNNKGTLQICLKSSLSENQAVVDDENEDGNSSFENNGIGGGGGDDDEGNWTTSVLLFLLWAALMYYVFNLAPNQTPSTDLYFVKKLSNLVGDDGFRMNQVLVSLWYIMGLWPIVYSMLLLPSARSSKSGIPVWPFATLSFFGGAYALIPYFILWRPPPPPVAEDEVSRWPLNFLESKTTAAVVGVAGLGLIVYAGLGYNDWKEFYQYFSASKLVHATSLDFSLLSAFAPFWVYNDMTARKCYEKTAWLLPLSIVPFMGPALYLLLRPPLTTLPVSLENTLKSD